MSRIHQLFFLFKVLKGGDVPDPVKELVAIKKHMKAEQERHEEEEKEKKETNDAAKKSTQRFARGFTEPFTGTIPFDLKWTTPNIKKTKVSGSLESYQPFIPPLNYKLDELISKPNEPDVLKKWKDFNFLQNSEL